MGDKRAATIGSGGFSTVQTLVLMAAVAMASFLVSSSLCRNSTNVVSTLNTATSDKLIARLAVVTEDLKTAQASLATAHNEAVGSQKAIRDVRRSMTDLSDELDAHKDKARAHKRRISELEDQLAVAKKTAQLASDVVLNNNNNRNNNNRKSLRSTDDDSARLPIGRDTVVSGPGVGTHSAIQNAPWNTVPTMPQCSGPPSTDGPNPTKSHVKCYQSSDWAEVCVYDVLCTDGDKPVIIDDAQPEGRTAWGHWGVGDNSEGYHTFDVYPRPPPKTRMVPLNSRARPYYMKSSALATAEWTDRSMWIIEPEYRTWEMQHLFFFSHGVFPMWEAQMSNDSWGGAIPPIEDVYYMVMSKFHFNDWNKNVLDILVPKTGTVHYRDDIAAQYSKKRLLCSRRGVLASNKPNLFSGMKGAALFRDAAYKKFNIRMPKQPPKKLVIFNRANAGRRFENMDEMEDLFKRYDIPYQVVSKHGSFENQVRVMSSAGVLILAHGAAATNNMFQPHRSVIIEVFPYLRKRFGFKTVADVIGNFYMPIFAWDKPKTGKSIMNETKFLEECEDLPSIKTNSVGTCDQAQKVVTIKVDINILEHTLIDAFDTIGYRIYDKTKPRKRVGAVAGLAAGDADGDEELGKW